MSKKLLHLKDLERIKSHLKFINYNHHCIFKELRYLLKHSKYQKIPYEFQIPAVRRAVANEDINFFNKLSKFGYPPTHFASLNRCSWKREPAFYCSTDNAVPIFEIRAKIGQFVALSQWHNNENLPGSLEIPIKITAVAIGVEEIVDSLSGPTGLKDILLEDSIFRDNTPKIYIEIDRFFGSLFSTQSENLKNLYWLTSALSKFNFRHLVASDGTRIDALIYPSVESKSTGANIVLTRKFAKDHLRLHGVSIYQVEDFDSDKRQYSMIPIKSLYYVDENENLLWKNVRKDQRDKRFIFSPDTPIQPSDSNIPLPLED